MHRFLHYGSHCLFPVCIPLCSAEVKLSPLSWPVILPPIKLSEDSSKNSPWSSSPLSPPAAALLLLLFAVMYWPNNQCHQTNQEYIVRQLVVPWENLLYSGEYITYYWKSRQHVPWGLLICDRRGRTYKSAGAIFFRSKRIFSHCWQ